tara:strand:+ start:1431 stop:3170 length:1740 start_codon:yes stop_codon:yes gene_type:complete
MNKNIDYSENFGSKSEEEVIDIGIIMRFCSRNIFPILSSTILFFILFITFALLQRRTWQGQFQIVLNPNEDLNKAAIYSGSDLLSKVRGDNASNLKTEVGILESPSVLMPIFELVNREKRNQNNSNYPDFFQWKDKNLKIKLKKGTSILDITYKDKNKDLIIPVLEKMSMEYQIYSGKNKKRKLSLTKKYLNEQINVFREKSSESIRKTQKYAMDQDLTMLDFESKTDLNNNLINATKNDSSNQVNASLSFFDTTNTGLEGIRIKAVNEINTLNNQIEKIEKMGNNLDELQYVSLTIPELVAQGLPAEINRINRELVAAKSNYKLKDPEITRLKNEKKNLIKSLKESSIGILKAKRILAQSLMESVTRPKDVVLKYKELMREADRDESTLIFLENNLRSIQLEEKRIEDPWKLITKPTLKKYPIAPKRKQIGLYGMSIGLIVGIIFSIFRDRNTDLVYEKKYLEDCLGKKVLEKLNIFEMNLFFENNIIFLEMLKSHTDKKIKVLSLGIKEKNKFEELKEKIQNFNKNINFTNKLSFENEGEILIVIFSLATLKFKDLDLLKKSLFLKNKKISGVFLVD